MVQQGRWGSYLVLLRITWAKDARRWIIRVEEALSNTTVDQISQEEMWEWKISIGPKPEPQGESTIEEEAKEDASIKETARLHFKDV